MASNSIETFLNNSQPLVVIPANLMEYIREIVDQCPDEISWVMEVTELDNFIYEIEGVFIPQQRVHGATTEFEAEDILHLMDNEPTFQPEKWRGWGHSHVNMGVSPSSQDRKQMMEFSKDCDFFVGMIHNKKGEVFCWVIDNTRKIFIKDVDVEVVSEYKDEVKKLIKERVSKLVDKPKNTGSTKTSLVPSTTNKAPGAVPFHMLGRNVIYCNKEINNVIQYGYEVEGVFFPMGKFPSAHSAVMAYNELLEEMQNEKIQESEFEEIPPVHEMEVLDEIDDYNSRKDNFNNFMKESKGLF